MSAFGPALILRYVVSTCRLPRRWECVSDSTGGGGGGVAVAAYIPGWPRPGASPDCRRGDLVQETVPPASGVPRRGRTASRALPPERASRVQHSVANAAQGGMNTPDRQRTEGATRLDSQLRSTAAYEAHGMRQSAPPAAPKVTSWALLMPRHRATRPRFHDETRGPVRVRRRGASACLRQVLEHAGCAHPADARRHDAVAEAATPRRVAVGPPGLR